MHLNNIDINTWANWLNIVADNKEMSIATKGNDIQLCDKSHSKKDPTLRIIKIDEIFRITVTLCIENISVSNETKAMISSGLWALATKNKEEELPSDSQKRWNPEWADEKIEELEKFTQEILDFSNLVTKNQAEIRGLWEKFKNTIPQANPESIEFFINSLLKDASYLQDPNNHVSIALMCERAAQLYLEKGDVEAALRIRMRVAAQIPPDPKLIAIISDILTQDPTVEGFGTFVDHVGTTAVKNGNIHFKLRNIDERPRVICVSFTVCHHIRFQLGKTLAVLKDNMNNFFTSLPQNFCENVIERSQSNGFYKLLKDNTYSKKHRFIIGDCESITFEGVGTVSVPYFGIRAIQNDISIEMESTGSPEEMLKKLHIMLWSLGMPTVLLPERDQDVARMKIFSLMRCFYPKMELNFTIDNKYFEISPEKLKKKMIEKEPKLNSTFNEYSERMYKQVVYPGRELWAVHIVEELKQRGAVGLMAGVSGGCKRIINILKLGALSSFDRFKYLGLMKDGVSSAEDLIEGAGDGVFARVIPESNVNDKTPVWHFPYCSNKQILIELPILERTGGYGYEDDKFGSKARKQYYNRNPVLELVTKIQNHRPFKMISIAERFMGYKNEFVIKNRVPPEYIAGVLVQSESLKVKMMRLMREANMVHVQEGVEYVNFKENVRLDQFVHCGSTFKKEFWNK